MNIRIIFMLFAVLLVTTACGKKDEAVDEAMMGEQDVITTTTDPMDGTGVGLDGVTPGSQIDLEQSAGDKVFFGYDQYNLTDEARSTLTMQAEWLKQYPDVAVVVAGHADERGTREYNLALGERRANSVKNYLIASGINPSRLRVISYGKERPAVPGSDPSAWAQNRRAVTEVE